MSRRKSLRMARRRSSRIVGIQRRSSLWEMSVEEFNQIGSSPSPEDGMRLRTSSKRDLLDKGRLESTIVEGVISSSNQAQSKSRELDVKYMSPEEEAERRRKRMALRKRGSFNERKKGTQLPPPLDRRTTMNQMKVTHVKNTMMSELRSYYVGEEKLGEHPEVRSIQFKSSSDRSPYIYSNSHLEILSLFSRIITTTMSRLTT